MGGPGLPASTPHSLRLAKCASVFTSFRSEVAAEPAAEGWRAQPQSSRAQGRPCVTRSVLRVSSVECDSLRTEAGRRPAAALARLRPPQPRRRSQHQGRLLLGGRSALRSPGSAQDQSSAFISCIADEREHKVTRLVKKSF